MNDRELLELAAKAAGIRHIEYTNDYDGRDGLMLCDEIGRHTSMWNPLTDDGDALRLAVKLNLQITYDSLPDGAVVKVSLPYDNDWFDEGFFWSEWLSKGAYAATRRAIVRAAAEIGRNMV